MTHTLQIIVDGIVIGSTYALVALGFTLVFGVVRVLNVAHADFFMLGAFVSLWIGVSAGLGTIPGILAGICAAAVAGLVLYLLLIRRLAHEQMFAVFMATLGVSLFMQNFIARVYGPGTVSSPPLFDSQFHDIAGVAISDAQILLIGATVLLSVGLVKWLKLSSLGRSMRAVAENSILARASGINVALVLIVTLMLASAIAAVGGVLVTNVTQTVSPFLATDIALKMFIVALVAGAGRVGGAVIAGILLGVAESFAVAYVGSSWQHVAGLLILVVILMVRPQGIWGSEARIG